MKITHTEQLAQCLAHRKYSRVGVTVIIFTVRDRRC